MHKLARLQNSVLEVFFLELYTFTMTSYSSQNKSIRIYSSRLNPFWQCLLSNSSAFSIECKSWIDNSVFSLIYTQLDENLNLLAIHSDEQTEDDIDEENFDEKEKTEKHDNLDAFTSLMK